MAFANPTLQPHTSSHLRVAITVLIVFCGCIAPISGKCCYSNSRDCNSTTSCKPSGDWCDQQERCITNCNGIWCPSGPPPTPPSPPSPPPSPNPPPPSPPTYPLPVDLVKKMQLGINLGNVLEAPVEGAWAPIANESLFDAYQAVGFKTVRIPVRYDNHTSESAPYKVDPVFMARVKEIVGWSMSRGFVTVINTHHEDWLDNVEDFSHKLPRLLAIWTTIANTFADADHSLLFEVYNEPHVMTVDDLNTMNSEVLKIIRQANPYRIVLFGGLQWMNPTWLTANPNALQFPSTAQDPYIMVEIHNYDPYFYAGAKPTSFSWGSTADQQTLQQWITDVKF